MYLLHCPQCRTDTPVEEDAERLCCRTCGRVVEAAAESVYRGAASTRWFVMQDLRPLSAPMFQFGTVQTFMGVMSSLFFGLGLWLGVGKDTPLVMLLFIGGLVLFVGGVCILAAGACIRTGRWRLLAVAGAILAITSPLLMGLPLGIRVLRKLTRPEVKAAFDTPLT